MADTAVAITAGAGTNIDTRTEATNSNHRQVIVIGDPSLNAGVAAVKDASTAPAATDPALVVSISPNSVNANGQATMAASAPVVIASNQTAIPVAGRSALWNTGTSNSGLLTTAITLQSTELNALANAALIISSVGGSSGKFTNADTAQAILGEIFFFLGTVTTMSVGANLAGWFLQSPDSGTTMESLTVVPPRSPDFIVPLDATAGNKTYKAAGVIKLPALQFKVLVQNNSGQTFTATLNTLKLAPISAVL